MSLQSGEPANSTGGAAAPARAPASNSIQPSPISPPQPAGQPVASADPGLVAGSRWLVGTAAIVSTAVGLSIMSAWWLYIRVLKTWGFGTTTAKINTGVCFALMGLALWVLRNPEAGPDIGGRQFLGRSLAAFASLVALTSFLEYIFNWQPGIDQLLAGSESPDVASGLMSPITAAQFVALGMMFIFLDWRPKGIWPAQYVCLAVWGSSGFALLSLLMRPVGTPTTMALPTAVTFFVLAGGMLLSRPAWPFGGMLVSRSPGSQYLRTTIPAALLVLVAIGGLISKALLTETHFTWLEVALLALVSVALMLGFVAWTAFILNRTRAQSVQDPGMTSLASGQEADPSEARLRRNVRFGFAAAVILTALLGFFSWRNMQRAASDAEWVAHTHEVLATLEAAMRALATAESGARGFALGGDDLMLSPLNEDKNLVQTNLARLRHLTADNVAQQRRLDVLEEQINACIASAEALVAARRANQTIDDQKLQAGIQLMQGVRFTAAEMEEEEQSLLRRRQQEARNTRSISTLAGVLASLLGMVILGIAGSTVQHQVKVAAGAQAQLRNLNSDLERRVAERTAALTESEQRLRLFIEHAPADLAMFDREMRYLQASRRWRINYGIDDREALGLSHYELFPGLPEQWIGAHRRGLAGETVSEEEQPLEREDGAVQWHRREIHPWYKAGGEIGGIVVFDEDVTERKRAQEQIERSLRNTERLLKDLTDQKFALDQHAIVAFTDTKGTILYVNDKFCEISGYARGELIGQNHRLLNSGYHSREFFQHMYRTIGGGKVWRGEIRNRARNGSYYWVDTTITPLTDEAGKPQQYVAIRADITQRKHAEQALRQQAEVLDQSQVLVREMDGHIRFWSKGMERLYGYTRSMAVGAVSHELLRTEFPGSVTEIERELRESGIWEGELIHSHRNGARMHVASVWLIQEEEGGIPCVIEADNDVTGMVQAKVDLQKQTEELSRSNRDLEQFAYAASHDLQEPLRAVTGCMQLLEARCRGKLDERGDEFMKHAVDGATRMQKLIEDLLAFSRVGTRGAELKPVECAAAVANALENLSVSITEKHAVIECGELPAVIGDLSQLALLFQNLVGNALKFCGEMSPRISISARREGADWTICIRDNGIGIDPQYFERIFVIFQRLHTRKEYPGTGMGLALCKRIVERHGGRIWVESGIGKGATFCFTLRSAATAQGSPKLDV